MWANKNKFTTDTVSNPSTEQKITFAHASCMSRNTTKSATRSLTHSLLVRIFPFDLITYREFRYLYDIFKEKEPSNDIIKLNKFNARVSQLHIYIIYN